MRRVQWSDLANIDLEKIDDYWMQYSQSSADEVLDKIERSANFLSTMPGAGPVVRDRVARKWIVATTRYILIYRVIDDRIEVLRVQHASQHWLDQHWLDQHWLDQNWTDQNWTDQNWLDQNWTEL